MEIFVATILGLIIGSFLNVVIHRLPKAVMRDTDASLESLLWPDSTAPCCSAKLSLKKDIPVISWLLLRSKCAHCGQAISARYILVETLTGAAFAWSAWQFDLTLLGLFMPCSLQSQLAYFLLILKHFCYPIV